MILPSSFKPFISLVALVIDTSSVNFMKAKRNFGFGFKIGGMTMFFIFPNFWKRFAMSEALLSNGRWAMNMVFLAGRGGLVGFQWLSPYYEDPSSICNWFLSLFLSLTFSLYIYYSRTT